MTKASDNAYPSILVTEGTEPTAPAAGKQRVYIDSTSHHLSRTDSSGTQVDLETNQGGGTPTFVGCRAVRSATQAITTATYTPINLTAADSYDTDAFHDPGGASPNNVTVPSGKAGYYAIKGYAIFANSTAGTQRFLMLTVNDVAITQVNMPFHTNVGVAANPAADYQLAEADVVELVAYQDTGGDLNITAAALSVVLLGT